MKLQEIMVQDVVQAVLDDSVATAAKRMRERGVGCLVITSGDLIKGIVTDRDLLACLAQKHDPYQCRLAAHMHRPVIVLRPDEEHVTAANVMREKRIKRLPIAKNGKLLGIVSLSDLAVIAAKEADGLRGALSFFTKVVRSQSSQASDERTADLAKMARSPEPEELETEPENNRVELLDAGGPG